MLLGVDGTARGERRRARFFAANAQVPLMVIAVGAGERIAAALPELRALLAEPLMTLERVRVCKRDGRRLGAPEPVAGTDPSGLAVWQKLMVYCGEQSRHAQRPLLLRARARAARGGRGRAPPRCAASGATTATTRPTATASASCAGACPSSR